MYSIKYNKSAYCRILYLVAHAVRFVKEQGIPLIMLTSNPTRITANKLYQKLGFEQKQTNVYRMNLE